MLKTVVTLIRWGLGASILLIVLGWLAIQVEQRSARFPREADFAEVIATAPPRWPDLFGEPRPRRGLTTTQQRIGGAFVSSPIPDPEQDRYVSMPRTNPLPLPESHSGRGIYLLVAPQAGTSLQDNFPRTAIAVVNATDQLLEFHSIGGTLPIVQEARDPNGRWRAIEYFPDVHDNAARVRVYLPPRQFWSTVIKSYDGDYATVCRAALELPDGRTLYSQEYPQAISLSQFDAPAHFE